MTHDELLAKAIEHLRAAESRRTNTPEPLRDVAVDLLPRRRVRDAVVVYLERTLRAVDASKQSLIVSLAICLPPPTPHQNRTLCDNTI